MAQSIINPSVPTMIDLTSDFWNEGTHDPNHQMTPLSGRKTNQARVQEKRPLGKTEVKYVGTDIEGSLDCSKGKAKQDWQPSTSTGAIQHDFSMDILYQMALKVHDPRESDLGRLDTEEKQEDSKPAAMKIGYQNASSRITVSPTLIGGRWDDELTMVDLSTKDTPSTPDTATDYQIALALQAQFAREDSEMQAARETESMLNTDAGKATLFVRCLIKVVDDIRQKFHLPSSDLGPLSIDDLVFLCERMLRKQTEFQSQGKPYHDIDLGYHYTQPDRLLHIRSDGLLTLAERTSMNRPHAHNGSSYGDGIYSANDLVSSQRYGPCGLVVARLKGNPTIGQKLTERNVQTCDSTIVNASKWVVLRNSSQCLPLISFSVDVINTNSTGFHEVVDAGREVVDLFLNHLPTNRDNAWSGIARLLNCPAHCVSENSSCRSKCARQEHSINTTDLKQCSPQKRSSPEVPSNPSTHAATFCPATVSKKQKLASISMESTTSASGSHAQPPMVTSNQAIGIPHQLTTQAAALNPKFAVPASNGFAGFKSSATACMPGQGATSQGTMDASGRTQDLGSSLVPTTSFATVPQNSGPSPPYAFPPALLGFPMADIGSSTQSLGSSHNAGAAAKQHPGALPLHGLYPGAVKSPPHTMVAMGAGNQASRRGPTTFSQTDRAVPQYLGFHPVAVSNVQKGGTSDPVSFAGPTPYTSAAVVYPYAPPNRGNFAPLRGAAPQATLVAGASSDNPSGTCPGHSNPPGTQTNLGFAAFPNGLQAVFPAGQRSSSAVSQFCTNQMLGPPAPSTIRKRKLSTTPPRETVHYKAPHQITGDLETVCRPCMASGNDDCSICLDPMAADTVSLNKCGHTFHRLCISEWLKKSSNCPNCQVHCREPQGKSPSGTMTINTSPSLTCQGYGPGTIEIKYHLLGGIQASYHPSPGVRYPSTSRTAYLPDNEHGRALLARLEYAFSHGLTFTIGTSLTTRAQNVITWASIHHKTSRNSGAHGFPDPNYFGNCNAELDGLGVPSSADLLGT